MWTHLWSTEGWTLQAKICQWYRMPYSIRHLNLEETIKKRKHEDKTRIVKNLLQEFIIGPLPEFPTWEQSVFHWTQQILQFFYKTPSIFQQRCQNLWPFPESKQPKHLRRNVIPAIYNYGYPKCASPEDTEQLPVIPSPTFTAHPACAMLFLPWGQTKGAICEDTPTVSARFLRKTNTQTCSIDM